MNYPKIPGFTYKQSGRSLGDVWEKPDGEYPEELWRTNYLHSVTPEPVEWLTVAENYFSEKGHGGRACVLARPENIPQILENDTWVGRDIGSFAIINDNEIEDGLLVRDGDVEVEFFCGVREHHRLRVPSVDVSHPFLWYWDAIPHDGGWSYLNAAGRDEPLVRCELALDSYEVQVRALELRHYLALRGLVMIVQHDLTTNAKSDGFS